jgi:ferredoxin
MDSKPLRDIAKKVLSQDEVKCLLGYEKGSYGFRVSPCILTSSDEVERLIFSPLCVHNLANYLTLENIGPLTQKETREGEKIAIVAKGCDSKAIAVLVSEHGVDRDSLVVIGIPCQGVVDNTKLEKRFPDVLDKAEVEIKDSKFVITSEGQSVEVPCDELLSDKCRRCKNPTPVIYNELVGEPIIGKEDSFDDVKELEGESIEEKLGKWQHELSKCVRCYACRNACPLCYCSDCELDRLRPQFIRRAVNFQENLLFHITRAFHLAGRCVDCGECERVCPQEIPLMELNRKLAKDVKELFDYEAGIDPKIKPLFATFKTEDSDEGIL